MTYTKQLVETDKVFAIVGHFGTNIIQLQLPGLPRLIFQPAHPVSLACCCSTAMFLPLFSMSI